MPPAPAWRVRDRSPTRSSADDSPTAPDRAALARCGARAPAPRRRKFDAIRQTARAWRRTSARAPRPPSARGARSAGRDTVQGMPPISTAHGRVRRARSPRLPDPVRPCEKAWCRSFARQPNFALFEKCHFLLVKRPIPGSDRPHRPAYRHGQASKVCGESGSDFHGRGAHDAISCRDSPIWPGCSHGWIAPHSWGVFIAKG